MLNIKSFFLNYLKIDTCIPETEYMINERLVNLILYEEEELFILKSVGVSIAAGISPRMKNITVAYIAKPVYSISPYTITFPDMKEILFFTYFYERRSTPMIQL